MSPKCLLASTFDKMHVTGLIKKLLCMESGFPSVVFKILSGSLTVNILNGICFVSLNMSGSYLECVGALGTFSASISSNVLPVSISFIRL